MTKFCGSSRLYKEYLFKNATKKLEVISWTVLWTQNDYVTMTTQPAGITLTRNAFRDDIGR